MLIINELISESLFFLLYNERCLGNFSTIKHVGIDRTLNILQTGMIIKQTFYIKLKILNGNISEDRQVMLS